MTDDAYTPAKPEDKPHAPPPDTQPHTRRWIVVAWWLGFGIPFVSLVLAMAAWAHVAAPIALGAALGALALFYLGSLFCRRRDHGC